jgi:WD40 repeat protein
MGHVYSVTYSPDGKQLVTGCVNSVRVWDTSSWSLTAVILIQVRVKEC